MAAQPEACWACSRLITDVGMPDMDGFELRSRILAERPELPVILTTGRPELRQQHPALVEPDRYF
jgi:FixJ family two-component response regulator